MAKTPPRRQQRDRLQQVGLAGTIGAGQDNGARIGLDAQS